jgi:hypothetical protein
MTPTKRTRNVRIGRPLLFVAIMAVVVLTPAMAGPPRPAASSTLARSVATAEMKVSYTVDDFDDRVRTQGGPDRPRRPNDFFGDQGVWNTEAAIIDDTVTCSAAFDCSLSLIYDLSAPGAEGGYWEELSYSYLPATLPKRDLRAYEQLRFRVRGDPAVGIPNQYQIEFVQNDWAARKVFTLSAPSSSWQWVTLDLTGTSGLDWSRVKQLAVKLVGDQLSDKTGSIFFDDFILVDQDFAGELLDLIERQAFLYFWEMRHPETGFVRDRAVDPFYDRKVTSVAAVGFELAAFGIGAERGWISRAEAISATHQVLQTLLELPQGMDPAESAGYQGFFYHLLDIETGLRAPDSELSTIDTALLMAGVLFARQYYDGNTQTEATIRTLADQLYQRVKWIWALRNDAEPAQRANQFYLAWKPEFHDCQASSGDNCYEIPAGPSGAGYFSGDVDASGGQERPTTWDYYTDEILLINLLALGSPSHGVPGDTFWAWKREAGAYGGHTLYQSWFGELFAHLIGQVWIDLRSVMEIKPPHINWWRNSGQAALANRQFAIDNAGSYATYGPSSWGLSSALGPPTNPLEHGIGGVGIYQRHNAYPRGDSEAPEHNGTVAAYAAAGSIMFLSADPAENQAYQALEYLYTDQPRLWGLYGFRDGFNLEQSWFAHDYIGIDQGMTLLAIENYRTGLVWNTLGEHQAIRSALISVRLPQTYLPIVVR